jgi:hypothetical protein
MKTPPSGRQTKFRAFPASLLTISCLLANGQAVARAETGTLAERITERFCETVRRGYARRR